MAIDGDFKSWLEEAFAGRAKFDEPMAKHTSFRVGGAADAFVLPESIEELCRLVQNAADRKVPWMVVGDGTNLLVRDEGIRGIVIGMKKTGRGISMVQEGGDSARLTAAAGTKLAALCRMAIEKGLAGMNFAVGIPGSVGGAIVMNAGTSLGSLADVIAGVKVLGTSGRVQTLEKQDLAFSYRNFSIKGVENPLVLEGSFLLQKGDPAAIRKEADSHLERRKMSQPTSAASAGCFFKNPAAGKSAGELIDMAGFKGKQVGGAKISEKHANYIVNTGGGTAADIVALMTLVQEKIYKKFDVKLEPEVKIVG